MDAHGIIRTVVSRYQSTPDLNAMIPDQQEDFIINSKLSEWQRQLVRDAKDNRNQIEPSRLRAPGRLVVVLATTGLKRVATLPKVPTAREQGLPFDVTTWQAIFLPKATPEAIVQRLNQAISQTLDTPSVRDRFTSIGEQVMAPERRGPEYLAKFVASEIERWSGQIQASGATMD